MEWYKREIVCDLSDSRDADEIPEDESCYDEKREEDMDHVTISAAVLSPVCHISDGDDRRRYQKYMPRGHL